MRLSGVWRPEFSFLILRQRGLPAWQLDQAIPSDAGFARHLRMGAGLRRIGLAGAAGAQLMDGVVHLRPEEAMVEAMLQGWRAQQAARGLRAKTIGARERLVRRFLAFTNEFPWQWSPAHVDDWTLTLTAEHHLAPATVRGYQTELRLFSEYLTDVRYGRAPWVPLRCQPPPPRATRLSTCRVSLPLTSRTRPVS